MYVLLVLSGWRVLYVLCVLWGWRGKIRKQGQAIYLYILLVAPKYTSHDDGEFRFTQQIQSLKMMLVCTYHKG
ncbi:hypothetical protein L211DRAFT_835725 [Terfezia boudieri ATCC MYA-4762]|uniref:Uncharacterized protein n=1 Tax=Terfezia boudieri ATCC MYA-4762 TaxID=1051890 RepID=A0A3N4LXP5_9PEZI|nr:hypothetical protein L211DRAFT_835725 [Terfezia boudieri ATCC MYA-4762]